MNLFRILKKQIFRIRIRLADNYKVAKLYSDYYGIKMGSNVRFTGRNIKFGSEPYLIEIGSNVTITSDVAFNTHDGGAGLFRKEFPGINVFGKVLIGDNVFIGHNSIIMPNVTIGNNVVVGAGSIVTRNIESNTVVAGIPAKYIKSIDDYKKGILEKGIFIKSNNEEDRRLEILSQI